MRPYPSILSLLCLPALGCGSPVPGEPLTPQTGRVAISWTLDGAFLTAERCRSERIEFMEVEVRGATGQGQVSFTLVQCALDRYSVAMAPLGPVVLRVGAMGRDRNGRPCLLRYGEAHTTATTTYPEVPTRVELGGISGGCRQ